MEKVDITGAIEKGMGEATLRGRDINVVYWDDENNEWKSMPEFDLYRPIGHIDSVTQDENGLTIKYTLNEEGRKLYGT